jgi:hypothetical protein
MRLEVLFRDIYPEASPRGAENARLVGEAAIQACGVARTCRDCGHRVDAPVCCGEKVYYESTGSAVAWTDTESTVEPMSDAEVERVVGVIEKARNIRLCGCKDWLDREEEMCFECALEAATQPVAAPPGDCPVCLEPASARHLSTCCNRAMHRACVAEELGKCPLCRKTAPFV